MRKPKSTLLVGFDSAWSNKNKGAISASFMDLGDGISEWIPKRVSLQEAETYIQSLQNRLDPEHTIIAIDQPIIVSNDTGQRVV